MKCPFCSAEVEIWTDEVQATCPRCKKIVTREGMQCCLDWCNYAKECVGEEAYNRYMKSKAAREKLRKEKRG
jgi:hypothetical protein